MKIYDISQELFTSCVFPGDPVPSRELILSIGRGDGCNLTKLTLCAHNGTHVDAPSHFLPEGRTVDGLDLHRVIGEALVVSFEGELTEKDIDLLIPANAPGRILFRGKAVVTLDAARALNSRGVLLVGVESQTVGPEDGPEAVHLELLGQETVLLEGIRLGGVPDGRYLLNAAPLRLGGADGAPCRAVLLADF